MEFLPLLLAFDCGRVTSCVSQVVSNPWLKASFETAVPIGDGRDYGYLWNFGRSPTPALPAPGRWIGAFDNGGQRLWLMPEWS